MPLRFLPLINEGEAPRLAIGTLPSLSKPFHPQTEVSIPHKCSVAKVFLDVLPSVLQGPVYVSLGILSSDSGPLVILFLAPYEGNLCLSTIILEIEA